MAFRNNHSGRFPAPRDHRGASRPSPQPLTGQRTRAKTERVLRSPDRQPFQPPETWYEPQGHRRSYRTVVQPAGEGYRHVLTPADVRTRLSQVPAEFTAGLEVVQFSRMTRKKRSFPCYGMQWGQAIYLYPIEENLVEEYTDPPLPAQQAEARLFGSRWEEGDGVWRLVWTPEAIRDFYLNNVLIHELGHLIDQRNRRSKDRERFADWFAIRYGMRPTQPARRRRVALAADIKPAP